MNKLRSMDANTWCRYDTITRHRYTDTWTFKNIGYDRYSCHVVVRKYLLYFLCIYNWLYVFNLGKSRVLITTIINCSWRERPTTVNNKTQYLRAIYMFCMHLRVSKERPIVSMSDTDTWSQESVRASQWTKTSYFYINLSAEYICIHIQLNYRGSLTILQMEDT